MAIWGVSGITDAILASTQDYMDSNAQQVVTNSYPFTKFIKEFGQIIFRGGTYAIFPTIDTELGNAVMYDGTNQTLTPAAEDVLGAPIL